MTTPERELLWEICDEWTGIPEEVKEKIRVLLAKPEPVAQEPVAWLYEIEGMLHDAQNPPMLHLTRWVDCREPWTETPLYASPIAANEGYVIVPGTLGEAADLIQELSVTKKRVGDIKKRLEQLTAESEQKGR